MRHTLHLGVQKALGVVASHYQVDLEGVSTGYVVPVGVDDEVAMNLLTQNQHPAPSTQQAERSWLNTRAGSESVPVNFPETNKG
jgi:hypothetical protein